MILKQPKILLPLSPTGSRITNLLKDRNARKIVVIALLLLLGGAWRIYDCYKLEIWLDEAFSLNTARGSLSVTWNKAINFEMQPPVYFLLLNLWTRISPNIEFARLLSVLFSIFSVFFIYRTWKYLFGGEWYWVMPAMLMFHSFHLWAASEARGYAAVILFTAASTYYFIRILIKRDGQQQKCRDFFFYPFWSLLGIFTNYYCGFLLLGHFLTALVWFDRKTFWRLLSCYLILSLFLFLWLPVLRSQFSLRSEAEPANAFVFESSSHFLNESAFSLRPIYWMAKFIFYFPTDSFASKVFVLGSFVLFLSVAAAARIASGIGKITREEAVLLITGFTPIFSLLALYFYTTHPANLRYYSVSYSCIMLSIAGLCFNIKDRKLGTMSMIVVLVIFLAFSTGHEIRFVKGNWKTLSAYVESREKGGDLILFFNSINFQLPFHYYYRGSNPIYNIPSDSKYEKYDPRQSIIQHEKQLHDFFEKKKAAAGRIWLVGREDIFGLAGDRTDLNGRIFEKYLYERFDLIEKKRFENAATIRLFVMKKSMPVETVGSLKGPGH